MKYNDQKTVSVSPGPNCVVGIGASAGGLEALQQFLTFLPSNTGMAFVIIQHLAPDHKSLLAEILGKYTKMPILEISDGMELERNHIYMIPPKYNIELEGDRLRLREYDKQMINHPIDIFFRSLAKTYANRSIAVILSGTGSDGTNGIRSVKEQNGLIIVQSPESAKFDGMPRNAISTGFADLVQKPDSIAREMGHIAVSITNAETGLQLSDQDLMTQVFSILRSTTNINYTYYKQTTILRRIERRLVITHSRNLQEYVNYLNNNPDEAKLLAREVLIGVTSFFRDADYFEVLKETCVKQLLKNKPQNSQIRVWVAGCSTGEEAYSIAIIFLEAMEELNIQRPVKIFATDLDPDAVSTAMRGVYGDNIIEDVSLNRLSRYFSRKGNKYVIHHNVRQMIIFAQHNVFQDPPFGKLDLISCRNVLIYFQTVLQRNLFAIFHRALNDHGYLFLGRSESVIDYDDVFKVLCANEKIFVHNASGKAPAHEEISYSMQNVENGMVPMQIQRIEEDAEVKYEANELDTSILETLMPACVLLNSKNELTRTYGDCGKFLSVPVGAATFDIFMMLKDDLKIAVSMALRDARSSGKKSSYDRVPVQLDGSPEYITIVAQPIKDRHGQKTDYTAVSFIRGKREIDGDMRRYQIDTAAAERIANLEQELKIAKANLRQTVSELESVNAELQAANEELLTANEELQSSNEELQSVNEELYTVNSEYQAKVAELGGLNDDMANFLSTTLVGIMMVDRDLNIRKFTEYISEEFNISDQDVGRSLRYLTYYFTTIDLIRQCREVLESRKPLEEHCASTTGKTYLIRIAPYLAQRRTSSYPQQDEETGKDKLEGLVLTFVDTTKQIDDKEQMEELSLALQKAVQTSQEKESFLSHMSHDMRTPLTAILGLTQLSLLNRQIPAEVRDNLGKIRSSGQYLLDLIEEILETSRLNAGKVVCVCKAKREDEITSEVAELVQEQMREAGISFTARTENSVNRYVMVDDKHLKRVLLNILSNSVKYTPQGGHVELVDRVSYRNGRSHHTYSVKDNGRGISKSFQKRMFLPFEQDESENGYRNGTGLGLYICSNLTEIMGGKITCSSEVGKGTEFTLDFSFDLATDDQVELQNYKPATYEEQVLYGKNVLLAEDNHINAEVIMKILGTKGIHSELATDGQEAIDLFCTQGAYHYQAILMDLMMPEKDGFEATRAIRSSGHCDAESVPIFALTADVSEGTDEKCRKAGMNGCIEKPVDSEQLFGRLAGAFEQKDDR